MSLEAICFSRIFVQREEQLVVVGPAIEFDEAAIWILELDADLVHALKARKRGELHLIRNIQVWRRYVQFGEDRPVVAIPAVCVRIFRARWRAQDHEDVVRRQHVPAEWRRVGVGHRHRLHHSIVGWQRRPVEQLQRFCRRWPRNGREPKVGRLRGGVREEQLEYIACSGL